MSVSSSAAVTPIDWHATRMVVFDVDGAQDDQKPLRPGISARLTRHSVAFLAVQTRKAPSHFTWLRGVLVTQTICDLGATLRRRTAKEARARFDQVCAIVELWMESVSLSCLRTPARPGFSSARAMYDAVLP